MSSDLMMEKGGLEDGRGDGDNSTASNKKAKLTVSERILTAEKYKTDGNEFYKEENYRAAIGKYHRGLLYLRDLGDKTSGLGELLSGYITQSKASSADDGSGISDEQIQEALELQVKLYNNLAACLLKGSNPNYEKIAHYCNCVLTREPDNAKALYRRGMALYHMKAYDDSRECLLKAKSVYKGAVDPNIRRYLDMCSVALSKQKAQEKARYHGMFDKVASDEEEQCDEDLEEG